MNNDFATFNVPAMTQHDAAVMLKAWMNHAQIELATEFPEVAEAPNMEGLSQIQVMLVEDLLKAIGPAYVENPLASVRELTGMELTLENFKKIVPALEALKNNPPQHGKGKV